MNLDDLKQMSPAEAMKTAAAFAGIRPEVVEGQWRTESGRGRNLLGPDTKWGRAKGHFQVLDGVHATIERRTGKSLDRNNFHDALFEYAHIMKENMGRYGSEDKAVLAYHGGWNQKNWGPKTQDYLTKVMGQLAPATSQEAPVGQPSGKVRSLGRNATLGPGGVELAAPAKELFAQRGIDVAAQESAYGAPLVPAVASPFEQRAPAHQTYSDGSGDKLMTAAQIGRSALNAAAAERAKPVDFWGSVYSADSVVGASYQEAMRATAHWVSRLGEDKSIDPAWKARISSEQAALRGDMNDEEWDRYASAPNEREAEAAKFTMMEARRNQRVMGQNGQLQALAGGFLGGALMPQNILLGYGVGATLGKLGYGSWQLAASGRAGAAAASTVSEGAIGGVLGEAWEQAMGEHRTAGDYLMAATTGAALQGAIEGPFRWSEGRAAQLHLQREALAERQAGFIQAARDELEPEAEPSAVVRRAEELEAGELRQAIQETSPAYTIPDSERFSVPDEEALTRAAAREGDEDGAHMVPLDLADDPIEGATWVNDAWGTDQLQRLAPGVGFTAEAARALPEGAHLSPRLRGSKEWDEAARVADEAVKAFAPGTRVILAYEDQPTAGGRYKGVEAGVGVIRIRVGDPDWQQTLTHELGHHILDQFARNADSQLLGRMVADWRAWRETAATGKQNTWLRRIGLSRMGSHSLNDKMVQGPRGTLAGDLKAQMADTPNPAGGSVADYWTSFHEFGAEQMVKHIEDLVARGDTAVPRGIAEHITRTIANAVEQIKNLYAWALGRGYVKPATSFSEFFTAVAARQVAATAENVVLRSGPKYGTEAFSQPAGQMIPNKVLDERYGLDLLPAQTPLERASKKAYREIAAKAETWAEANPVDPARAKTLMENRLFNVSTFGHQLATSENPILRMTGGLLVEDAMGATGRRPTAAVAAARLQSELVGDALIKIDGAYDQWNRARGTGAVGQLWKELTGKDDRLEFNRAVAEEIYARGWGKPLTDNPHVKAATDAAEAWMERHRVAQVQAKTPGWANLPGTAKGYMPQRLDPKRILQATLEQKRMLAGEFAEQFQLLGYDKAFSDKLARAYMGHAQKHAQGGMDVPANVFDPATHDYVRQAMKAAGMTKEEVEQFSNRLAAGAPTYAKARLQIDMSRKLADGTPVHHFYDTDFVGLMRRQARRVAGDVALMQQGVPGKQGVRLLRDAAAATGADPKDLRAFDQAMADLTGEVTGEGNPFVDNMLALNATARLPGMGFAQLAEQVGIAYGTGLSGMMRSVSSAPRMIAEIRALARGEKVNNPIIGTLEGLGGQGEYGLEGYRLVMRYDNPNANIDVYGSDGSGFVTKALRGAGRAMSITSAHRLVHAVQRRAAAQEVVRKVWSSIGRGEPPTPALVDMGFTPDVWARLQQSKDAVRRDPGGRLLEFDATRLDPDLAMRFQSATDRGVSQMIQSAFAGEQTGLHHSALGRIALQFRSFPLLAMEKQWGRNRAMHGAGTAMAMALAAVPWVLPIMGARILLKAQFMAEDEKERYLDRALAPQAIMKTSLQYVGILGLAPDMFDALAYIPTQMSPELKNAMVGGEGRDMRSRPATLGSLIPAAGYVEDILKAPGALSESGDPRALIRLMPVIGNLPYFHPIANALADAVMDDE